MFDFNDAEDLCETYLRRLGYGDARRRPEGADGGVDIEVPSASMACEVKSSKKPIGRPQLQKLVGAAVGEQKDFVAFFSMSGYSASAIEYADRVGTLLFTFSPGGPVTPHNNYARSFVDTAQHHTQMVSTMPAAPPVGPLERTKLARWLHETWEEWRRF